jgi:hypothetical protein
MIRTRQVIVGMILLIAASACTQRTICPAYQSAFIHDKQTLDRHFSYFGEDSMPKILQASKGKHLLIDPVTYRRKTRSLQTIVMKDIYPQEPDSLAFNDEFGLAERDPEQNTIDSTAVASADSIYVISIKKEKFNIDQELYLWYLKDFIVYPDVKLQMDQNAENQSSGKNSNGKKKGFFKRLFGKKDKADKTNFDQETSATELDEGDEKKKGFGLFKKKDKKDKPVKEIEAKPATLPNDPLPIEGEEEEDEGDDDF